AGAQRAQRGGQAHHRVRRGDAVPATDLLDVGAREHVVGPSQAGEAVSAAASEPVLETKELAKDYGDQLGLDPTTLKVGGGELVLLVGPNGAGKSTFLGLCGGLLEP